MIANGHTACNDNYFDEDVFPDDMTEKRTENLSDLFPPRSRKRNEDQALNVADDILAQVDQLHSQYQELRKITGNISLLLIMLPIQILL